MSSILPEWRLDSFVVFYAGNNIDSGISCTQSIYLMNNYKWNKYK